MTPYLLCLTNVLLTNNSLVCVVVSEQSRLLHDENTSINSEADCCDYGVCFGSSSDAQARTVRNKDSQSVDPQSTVQHSTPDYGTAHARSPSSHSSIQAVDT